MKGRKVIYRNDLAISSDGEPGKYLYAIAQTHYFNDKRSPAHADVAGVLAAMRSVGLLDLLSSAPAGPSVARPISMPVCAASLRNLVRKAG